MGARDEAVARAKTVLQTLLQTGIVAAGSALFPFLGLPIVNQIFSFMVGKISEYMVNKGEFQAFAYMIDERVSVQTKEFFDSALVLETAKKSGDKNAIKLAESDLIRAADKFFDLKS